MRSNLVSLRRQFQTVDGEVAPSYTDFFAKLVAAALNRHTMLNATWDSDDLLGRVRSE